MKMDKIAWQFCKIVDEEEADEFLVKTIIYMKTWTNRARVCLFFRHGRLLVWMIYVSQVIP
jgi:hypothetical protein